MSGSRGIGAELAAAHRRYHDDTVLGHRVDAPDYICGASAELAHLVPLRVAVHLQELRPHGVVVAGLVQFRRDA